MATIADILRFKNRNASRRIYEIKKAAFAPSTGNNWTGDYVRTRHINPKHELWAEYQSLKINVSQLLTALRIEKGCPKYNQHAGKNPAKRISAARKTLVTLHKKIEKGKKFPEVDVWTAEREEALREKVSA